LHPAPRSLHFIAIDLSLPAIWRKLRNIAGYIKNSAEAENTSSQGLPERQDIVPKPSKQRVCFLGQM
jgi:hypothetical protein